MPERSSTDPHIGLHIGNYQLLKYLGHGGFATVYLGKHLYLPRYAAIKLLRASFHEKALRKFRKEAQIIAGLRHRHIINVIDFGIDESTHRPYLIMDYAANGSLRQRHPSGSVLAPQDVLLYLKQLASALDYAHSKGVIHRDIKPENMLLGTEDEALLSDFGIAAITSASVLRNEISISNIANVAGTPVYMAPEQLRGKAQEASDQYSLATVVYEWLCGQRPFRGKAYGEIINAQLNLAPPPLSERNPRITPQLEDVVLRALSKSPAGRFTSVGEFATAFEEALQPRSRRVVALAPTPPTHPLPVSPPVPTRANRQPATPTATSKITGAPTRKVHGLSRRTLLLGAGSALIAGGIAAGSMWMVGEQARTRTLPTPTEGITPTRSTGSTQAVAQGTKPPEVGTRLNTFKGHTKTVRSVAWSPRNDLIASGSSDKTVKVWHAASGIIKANYDGYANRVDTVAWSPDGAYIALGGANKEVHICEASTGNRVRFYTGHQDEISSTVWSPDGIYIASAGVDQTVQIWKAATGELVRTYKLHQGPVGAVAWSPDGNYIASASSDQTVHVWKAFTDEQPFIYKGHQEFVGAVLWTKDGTRIISAANDKTVQVWDAFTGLHNYAYREHKGAVFSIALSPNGTQVASGSTDRTVHLWNLANAEKIFEYIGHSNVINSVTWSPDGGQIASGGDDVNVQVWQAM
jgi:WD40 repeat protein/tRNA A-37 threonylcarbamoyl transferase component Bud32